ncbi:hypothetical protein ILUMI_01141 [Ignelater luminosus]|uniref:Reverse transcriptase domain-containing protein n=1 Tax=Ignelater luminosus TaxID=2038154 RepID=A0A8K0DJ22_IGNLU|nr:hypothetical protein ILUMI_01141 [Ignelater luminosus]
MALSPRQVLDLTPEGAKNPPAWHSKIKEQNCRQTEELEISNGVRQGCILSPLLFNVYKEKVFQKALHDQTRGIKIDGIPINSIRYADDTAIPADNIEDLQNLLNNINTVEMWTIRRLLKISWVDYATKEEALRKMGTEREHLQTIKQRKVPYLGHILRNNKYDIVLKLILMATIKERRGPGRKKYSWLGYIRN